MQAGERLTYQGYEVCLFPMDYLYCTQVSGPDSYSHCCGHPADWIGTYDEYPIYAPFSCHLVYSDGYSVGNTRAYSSDNPVWTPMGLTYVTVSFTHDNSPPAATGFDQGDLIAHTGIAGYALGDHCHMDQSDINGAQLISYGIWCDPDIPFPCYALDGSEQPYDIFYLSGNETVAYTHGMTFETWSQPVIPVTARNAILLLAAKKKRRSNYARIKRYTGII